ncbi:MAG TPA: SusE domain-containing protein, partial [Hanamia sp.]|nr:SusE domain-containing protein [Hanamia sp.]
MKKIFLKLIIIIVSGSLLFTSCAKDETKVIYEGGTSPVLTANMTDSIPLPVTDTTENAVTFSWTNPNYEFSDGISSLNVNYYLQIDTSGANFSSPNMQT